MDKINEIASKHLGRTSDGSLMKTYETPTEVDASLLVGVPRELNRIPYGIDYWNSSATFTGYDVWNCYEFSTLLQSGMPISGVLKIVYPANSKNIVESKSLKLYLNSYNMCKSGVYTEDLKKRVEEQITNDLIAVLETIDVKVNLFFNEQILFQDQWMEYSHDTIRLDAASQLNITFNHYKEDPNLLRCHIHLTVCEQRFASSALRSNCRVTNQPDWGDIFIFQRSNYYLEPVSLLQYIVSMRAENHFHEEVCELIFHRLKEKLCPSELFVGCNYTRRGGIDINPCRATSPALLSKMAGNYCDHTMRSPKMMRQ